MNKPYLQENPVGKLRPYIVSLFDSVQQVRNLRKVYPAAVDVHIYDILEKSLSRHDLAVATADTSSGGMKEVRIPGCSSKAAKRFRTMLSNWQAISSQALPENLPSRDDVSHLFGSVWTVAPHGSMKESEIGITERIPPVVLGESIEEDASRVRVIQVFPLSLWTEFATDTDLIVSGAPLPNPMMIEVWNGQPMLRSRLFRCLGSLAVDDLQRLAGLVDVMRDGGQGSESTVALSLDCGLPLGDENDIRRTFQQIELLRTLAIRAPALVYLQRRRFFVTIPVEDESHHMAMAAGNKDSERPLRIRTVQSASPPVRIEISECVDALELAVEVRRDPERVTTGAAIINDDEEILVTIPDTGCVRIAKTNADLIAVRLANGEMLDLNPVEE